VCCEQLVCAACAGRVSDGRCPTCRAYRDAHHGGSPWADLAIPVLALLAILLVTLALHSSMS